MIRSPQSLEPVALDLPGRSGLRPQGRTKMHRCLQVPEILRSIMHAVSDRESTYHRLGAEDTYAYVAAALTCKLFYEPAMDCLWAVLPSLTFLMTTLPRDAWSGTPKWYHNFVLLREPARDEWARFFLHAKRVRYLSLMDNAAESTRRTGILAAIFNAVASNNGALFPALRRLDISFEVQADDLPYLTMLLSLSPSLEEFVMTWRDTPLKQSLLASLVSLRPTVSSLQLISWTLGSPEDTLIMKFTKLRKLTVRQHISANTLYRLSSLNTLQVLDVTFLSRSYHIDDIIRPHDAFPSLTYLNLDLIAESDIVAPFLSRMSCHKLQRLEFAFVESDTVIASNLDAILEAVGRFSALSRLSLRQMCVKPDDAPAYSTFSIRPLLRLRRLEWLSLRTSLLLASFTDAAIAEFGCAWPRLVTLSYERSDDDDTRPLLTLRALSLFATHLPRLRWFALALDAENVPAPMPAPLSQEPISMVFAGSVVDYKAFARVAEYIASVYPRADVWVNATPDRTAETMFWTNVGSVVPVIAKLREDNRRLRAGLDNVERELAAATPAPAQRSAVSLSTPL